MAESRAAENTQSGVGHHCQKGGCSRGCCSELLSRPWCSVVFLPTLTLVKSPSLKSIASLSLPLEIAHSEVLHLVQQSVLGNCIVLCHLKDDFCICVPPLLLKPNCGLPQDRDKAKSCFQNPMPPGPYDSSLPTTSPTLTPNPSYLHLQLSGLPAPTLLPFTAPRTSLVLSLPLLKNHQRAPH